MPIFLINSQVLTKSNSISMSAIVPSDSPAVNLIVSGSSGSIPFAGGILIFKGYAYPNALITLKRDGQIIASVFADANAFFEISLTQMNLGKSDFILGAQEVFSGNFSIFYKFNLEIERNSNMVIDGIVFPSILNISKNQFISGEKIKFFGFSIPNSEINLKINSNLTDYSILTDSLGKWDFIYYTDLTPPGIYEVKVKTLFNNLISEYSAPLFLEIKKEKSDFSSSEIIDKNKEKEKITIIEIPLYPEKPVISEEKIPESSDLLLKIVYSIWLYLILLLIPLLIFWLRRHKK